MMYGRNRRLRGATRQLNIRVDVDLYDELARISRANGNGISMFVDSVIRTELERRRLVASGAVMDSVRNRYYRDTYADRLLTD